MTQLHFDCFSGISGDMILGALVDLGLPLKDLAHALKRVPLDGYRLQTEKVRRGPLSATKVDVLINRRARPSFSLRRIHRIIDRSRVPATVKEQGHAVFEQLARAEGRAHRIKPSNVTFHEVGAVDALVDVMGSLLGCHLLNVARITASSVNLGSGFIESTHGLLPAPGPAVAMMAKGIPVYSAGPRRELATPTGLAFLTTLAAEFGPLPLICPRAVGYGAGTADPTGWPNALRVFLGDPVPAGTRETDRVIQLETNLDDMNPQMYGAVMERLFASGALDVTLTPVIMKQGRPGILLTALAAPEKAPTVGDSLLRETSTLGVRVQELSRRVLPRRMEEVQTQHGVIRIKVADLGDGRIKAAPEYQDCERIARRTGQPVREILHDAALAYRPRKSKRKA
jgi:uncharacterized protein (TIGR00299 family) protein